MGEVVVRATGAGVRAELGRRGMSKRELARRLGWTVVRLDYWLVPSRRWPLEYAKQAAAALEVPVVIGAGLTAAAGHESECGKESGAGV